MFNAIKKVASWYLNKPMVIQEGLASQTIKTLTTTQTITIISSPHAIEYFKSITNSPNITVLLNPPLEVDELDTWLPKIKDNIIVAIGGGVIMDTAKYLAFKKKLKLIAIPSVLSTTSWLNMGIAIRKNKRLYFPGAFRGQKIIVDPDYICKSPPELSYGGIADILCMCSALTDWELAHTKNGEKISAKGVRAFSELAQNILTNPEALTPFSPRAVRKIHEIFFEALALCGPSFSDRPLEGSEHFLYYCQDELASKRLVHGNIIALNILICLKLQEDPRQQIQPLRKFLDSLGVRYSLKANNIDSTLLRTALQKMPDYVKETKKHYTIWNTFNSIPPNQIDEIIQWVEKF